MPGITLSHSHPAAEYSAIKGCVIPITLPIPLAIWLPVPVAAVPSSFNLFLALFYSALFYPVLLCSTVLCSAPFYPVLLCYVRPRAALLACQALRPKDVAPGVIIMICLASTLQTLLSRYYTVLQIYALGFSSTPISMQ